MTNWHIPQGFNGAIPLSDVNVRQASCTLHCTRGPGHLNRNIGRCGDPAKYYYIQISNHVFVLPRCEFHKQNPTDEWVEISKEEIEALQMVTETMAM